MRLALAVATVFVTMSSVAIAANSMYRWVDAKGQVHYSQSPPSAGTFKDVTPRQAPTRPGAAAVSAPKPSAAAARVSTPASIAETNRKTTEYNENIRAQNCKNSQSRLVAVQTQGPASSLQQQPDGSVAPYSETNYQQAMADAQKAIADSCGK